VLLACGVLALAAYGSVVVGRAGLMPMFNILPENGGTASRYHYAAQAWLVLAIATAWAVVARRLPATTARALVAAGIVAVLAGHLLRPHPYDLHPLERTMVAKTLAEIRAAAAAAPPGDVVRIPNRPYGGAPILRRRPFVFPGIAAVFLVFHPDDTIDGRRIVFEAPRDHAEDAQRRGGRIARLLVPPPDGRPDPPYALAAVDVSAR
jgi:hypothetical protein